jgi:hypothetical protein
VIVRCTGAFDQKRNAADLVRVDIGAVFADQAVTIARSLSNTFCGKPAEYAGAERALIKSSWCQISRPALNRRP